MKHNWSHALKGAHLKKTPARERVLRAFSAGCKPLSAEDLFRKTRRARINQATVYRTLTSLERAGIVRRVELRKDAAHYELASHHHHHIVCTTCGTTERFDGCSISPISKNALKKSRLFSRISEHSLELFGICKRCARV